MLNEERITDLTNIAYKIAHKSADTFVLVTVDSIRTGRLLESMLERSFGISKNRITKLGPTSTAMQDAINLAQQRDIVIAPRDIVNSTSPIFSPSNKISKLMIVDVNEESATIQYQQYQRKMPNARKNL